MIFSTVKLDVATWDLTLDALGNIAVDTTSYAVAQDVASAIRTYKGEDFYDVTIGISYDTQVLGQRYNPALTKAFMEQAALSVPGVVQALAVLALNKGRVLTGEVKVIDENGQKLNVRF